jgi:hypothetical protein
LEILWTIERVRETQRSERQNWNALLQPLKKSTEKERKSKRNEGQRGREEREGISSAYVREREREGRKRGEAERREGGKKGRLLSLRAVQRAADGLDDDLDGGEGEVLEGLGVL